VGVAGYDFPRHRLGGEAGVSASDPADPAARLRATLGEAGLNDEVSPAAPVPAYRDSAPVGRDRRLRWPFWRTVDPARAYAVPPALPWLNRNVYQVRYTGPDAGGTFRDNPEDSGYLRSPVAPDERFDRIESLHAWLEAEDLIRPVTEDLALTSVRRDIAWRLDELAEHAEVLYLRHSEYRALSGAEPRLRAEQAGELIELRSAFATQLDRILEFAEEYGISLGKPVTLGTGLERLAHESAQLRLESDAPLSTDGMSRDELDLFTRNLRQADRDEAAEPARKPGVPVGWLTPEEAVTPARFATATDRIIGIGLGPGTGRSRRPAVHRIPRQCRCIRVPGAVRRGYHRRGGAPEQRGCAPA
jgi:hypothetical protein